MAPASLHPGKHPWWIEVIFLISENPLTWIPGPVFSEVVLRLESLHLSIPGCIQSSIPSERTCRSWSTWLHWAALSQVLSVSMVLALEYGHPGWLPLGPAGMLIWTGGPSRNACAMSWIGYFCSSHDTVHSHLISSETRNPTHSKEGVAKWDHYLSWIWTRQSRRCKHCQFACSIISINKNISWYEYTYYNYDFTTAHHKYLFSCLLYWVSVTLMHKICTAWNAGAWPFDLAKFCSSTKALCDAANSACDLAQHRWNPREMCWKKLNVTLVSWNCIGILKNDSLLPPSVSFFFLFA